MPFNPYSTRPVGSPEYEEHLLDVMTRKHYEEQIPFEDDLVKEAAYGHWLWHSRKRRQDPWETLAGAVVSLAIQDYLDACIRDIPSQQERLRKFFSQNEFLTTIFADVLRRMEKAPSLYYMRRRMKMLW